MSDPTIEQGPPVETMTPLQLVAFCIGIMAEAKADPVKRLYMTHGKVLTSEPGNADQLTLANGMCGCAIGTIALRDGVDYRASIGFMGNEHYETEARGWLSGGFGGRLFAAMSRAFEGAAIDRAVKAAKASGVAHPYHRWLVVEEDIDAVLTVLRGVERVIVSGIDPQAIDAFRAIEPEWGIRRLLASGDERRASWLDDHSGECNCNSPETCEVEGEAVSGDADEDDGACDCSDCQTEDEDPDEDSEDDPD